MLLIDYLQKKTNFLSSELAVVEAETGASITYEQLWDRVYKLSSKLKSLGLDRHDCVALILPNSIDWIVCFFAVLKSGGIVVPIRESVTSSEAKWLINKTKPTFFIGDSSFINRSLPFDLLDDGQRVVLLSKKVILKSKKKVRINNLNDLITGAELISENTPIEMSSTPDIATINFTYRGYGYPLGAMLSNVNYIEGVKAYSYTAGFEKRHRVLAIHPFCFIYPLLGCVLSPLATGSTIITCQGFSPHKIWEIIHRFKIDVLTAVPSLYSALLHSSNPYKSDLKITHAFCGGSLMPVGLYKRMKDDFNISLRQGYGLTECLPIACNPSHGNRPETLGKILTGSERIDIKIFDENGIEKNVGEAGEIAVTGPTVTKGYYCMARETDAILRKGWFYTGDLGWFDSDGYLHFSGIKKRIAKVGGNMVDLAEVENRLLDMPGISSVNVYSIPDDRWGQVVGADITSNDSYVDVRTVRQYLKPYLATYKLPKVIRNLL